MRRPSPLRILALLVLGLTTSVLVAWAAATYAYAPRMHAWHIQRPTGVWTATLAPAVGLRTITVSQTGMLPRPSAAAVHPLRLPPWVTPTPARVRVAMADLRPIEIVHDPTASEDSLPAWTGVRDLAPGENMVGYAAGWPLNCLYAVEHYRGPIAAPTEHEVTGLLRLRPRSMYNHFDGSLPVAPLWGPLLANTALYAGTWWGVLSVVAATARAIRNRRRARHGCCPVCAYDLRGDLAAGCPECGWGRATA